MLVMILLGKLKECELLGMYVGGENALLHLVG